VGTGQHRPAPARRTYTSEACMLSMPAPAGECGPGHWTLSRRGQSPLCAKWATLRRMSIAHCLAHVRSDSAAADWAAVSWRGSAAGQAATGAGRDVRPPAPPPPTLPHSNTRQGRWQACSKCLHAFLVLPTVHMCYGIPWPASLPPGTQTHSVANTTDGRTARVCKGASKHRGNTLHAVQNRRHPCMPCRS